MKTFSHAVNLCFDSLMFTASLSVIVKNMEITFFFIRRIKLFFYSNSTYFIVSDTVSPVFLKSSFYFQDKTFYKFFHTLHHNDKLISVFVHVVYIFFTEISSIQNKTNIFVAITACFFQHVL